MKTIRNILLVLVLVIAFAFVLYMAEMLGLSTMGIVLVMGMMMGALVIALIWLFTQKSDEVDFTVKLKEDTPEE